VAPASGVSLTAASVHARLPVWVGSIGANTGLLKPGENQIPTKVWVALAGDVLTPGVQVLAAARSSSTASPGPRRATASRSRERSPRRSTRSRSRRAPP
jgi:hypothetical protein